MGRIKIEIGQDDREFITMQTTAPKSYDYSGVLYIDDTYDEDMNADVRIVLIPDDMVTVCKERCMSGLYTLKECPNYMTVLIEETLWEKLYTKREKKNV